MINAHWFKHYLTTDVGSFSNQGNSGSAAITALVTSVNECRVMVKTLVSGMKTIVWGAGSCKLPGSGKWVGVPLLLPW